MCWRPSLPGSGSKISPLKGLIIFYTSKLMQIKMKYYGIVLLSLLWIEAVSQVPATPLKDVPGFRARLETLSDKVSTIESDFIQEKSLSVLANTIVSRGHFWYKKENNIRWEYVSPYKYLIIITNNQIFIKE